MRKFYVTMACLGLAALGWTSCVDTEALESQLTDLEGRAEALEERVAEINENAIATYNLIVEGQIVMDVRAYENGQIYAIDLSDGSTINIYVDENGEGISPVLGIDENGEWYYTMGKYIEEPVSLNVTGVPQVRVNTDNIWEISADGGQTWEEIKDDNGNRIPANANSSDSFFTSVEIDENKENITLGLATGESVKIPVFQSLTMELAGFDEDPVIRFGQEKTYDVKFSEDVADAIVMQYPEGWRIRIEETADGEQMTVTPPASGTNGEFLVEIWLKSDEQYIRKYKFPFLLGNIDLNTCKAWQKFMLNAEDNVLLDFSYAGYNHGESAPDEVSVTVGSNGKYTASNGYTVYNIKDYGAKGDGTTSDRAAFLEMLKDIFGPYELKGNPATQVTFPSVNSKKAVIYFPEGNYVLHTSDDDVTIDGKKLSQTILIRGGDVIMKGAGRDKTTITMKDLNQPNNPSDMYSSPDMLQFKHNAGIQEEIVLATVTGNAEKGDFSVEVSGLTKIKAGDWVCLWLKNKDIDLIREELAPYYVNPASDWAIVATDGVSVQDLHQVKSVSGNTVTFHEPIMHKVDPKYGWTIVQYQAYANVGIEDLTFAGNAKEKFDHHATWEDDGGYKPISMTRVVNSWMRRVNFVSVSEASSIIESANVSVYDCEISGTRGHSAIRSQASSRVFIGAILDKAHGYSMDDLGHEVTGTDPDEITGQYHAVGVSKQSMGAVLWRNTWGSDGCFESHATQPRATLIDYCKGSFRQLRQGGDEKQMPNHLADLTIWNFNNTTAFAGEWIWWNQNSKWWKFLPPVVVGFHGQNVDFDEEQTKYIESNGSPVQPESLYEAQLEERLGSVPEWLTALKQTAANQ